MQKNKSAISIDELLKQQTSQQNTFIATIQATDDDNRIKITPYYPENGCMCSKSITVNKNTIESVTPTGETHFCCGKKLAVVEINFKENAKIDLSDIISQIIEKINKPDESNPHSDSVSHQPSARYGGDFIGNGFYQDDKIVCPFGYDVCRGTCGTTCYSRSKGETCSNGNVCAFGYDHCGCQCYRKSAGETCYKGQIHHHPSHYNY